MHLFYPPDEAPAAPRPSESAEMTSAANADGQTEPTASQAGAMEAMQSELAELHETVAELRRRVDALESRIL
jgi:uncharacterized protein YceH (UPF0502 family)